MLSHNDATDRLRLKGHPSNLRIVVCLLASTLTGCKPSAPARIPAGQRPNVLLILTDTTRADELGCYGGQQGVTPRLDALASSGTRYTTAYAHAPWTLPSIASLLTSRHPASHGASGGLGDFTPLPKDIDYLPELLRASGYTTGAVLNVLFLSERFGMTRGFEHVDYYESTTNTDMRRAELTTDAALSWIKTVRQNAFFAFVHYFDPHLVYDPPDSFRSRYASEADVEPTEAPFGTKDDMKLIRSGKLRLTQDRADRLRRLYRGEIAYMDEQIGRLIDGIREMGLYNNTLIVVVGDHGEEFLDHQGFEHGHTLYEEIVRVPLLFAGYEIPAEKTVDMAVGLIDVAPTICELADVQIPSGFAGRTLLPAFEGQEIPPRPILSQGNMWGPPLNSLMRDGYKFIRTDDGNLLYDLKTDPDERRDLTMVEPDRVKQMGNDLTLLLESLSKPKSGSTLQLSEEERNRLCSLGYIECGD